MKQFLERVEDRFSAFVQDLLIFADDEVPVWFVWPAAAGIMGIALVLSTLYLIARFILVPRKYWP